MKEKPQTILVLGATGFVGQTVFSYLAAHHMTFGTARQAKGSKIFAFDTASWNKDFHLILKKLKSVSLVINCIGIYTAPTTEAYTQINALFPHQLEMLSKQYSFRLIHISTDAVFGNLQGKVTESTTPIPTSLYGMSKLLGETTDKGSLTIRSSFIGTDAANKKGLLSYALNTNIPNGYSNQTWAGCTTLQFAKLCELLMDTHTFKAIRKNGPVFHFAPLPKTTKYELLKTIRAVYKQKSSLKKVESEEITRYLFSPVFDKELPSVFSSSYTKALEEIQNYKL